MTASTEHLEVTSAEARVKREREFHDHRFAHDTVRAAARKYYWADYGARSAYEELLWKYASGSRALEYGCGPGSYSIALAQKGARTTAIDISSVAIDLARQKAEAEHAAVEYKVMNAESMSFPDRSFDLICGTGILHHLELRRALPEIARTLAPNGHAVFLEGMGHNPLINLYRKLTPRMRSEDEHPLRIKDLEVMRDYFESVECRYFNLTTIFAAPIQSLPGARTLRRALHGLDQALFRIMPFSRRYAWMMLVLLAKASRVTK
jgi:SAM-dependent methyltransferase